MATNIFSATPSNTSDALFRTWGGGLSAAFASVGLIKTSDTGQINWSTVLKPTAGGVFMGYEVWRLNDSLQATAPLFFRFEYGAAAANVAYPSFRFWVGKGSDGVGNITGVLPGYTLDFGTSSGSASNWYVSSGDGSMLAIAPAQGTYTGVSAATTWSFWIERSRNDSGAAIGTGLAWGGGSGTTSSFHPVRVIDYASGTALSLGSVPSVVPGSTGLSSGGNTPLFPLIVTAGLGQFWQPRAVMSAVGADIGANASFPIPGFGTYMSVFWEKYDQAGQSTSRAAIWWQ